MTEEKAPVTLDDLLKQIDDFMATLKGLESNVNTLRKKLLDNKSRYGPDINKWPKEK